MNELLFFLFFFSFLQDSNNVLAMAAESGFEKFYGAVDPLHVISFPIIMLGHQIPNEFL